MNMMTAYQSNEQLNVGAVATIVAAYLTASRNPMSPEDVKALVIQVRCGFVADLNKTEEETLDDVITRHYEEPQIGLVPGRKLTTKEIQATIKPDFLICLEDNKPYKVLKGPLNRLKMTPDQYRMKWGLPHDYPMVAPSYSAARKAFALTTGLGRK